MKKEYAKKWVKALRSGEYKQGEKLLHNEDDNTFCCLGVLNDLFPEMDLAGGNDRALDNFYKIGLSSKLGMLPLDTNYNVISDSLAGLNDYGWSFEKIADVIEKEYINKGE